jgi:predicted RNase H-like nuclease (RuvC/YqgF family)
MRGGGAMTVRPAIANHFRFSVRTLLAVTAVVALLLVPIAWVAHQREKMLWAREEAIRAVVLAERYRSKIEERSATNRLAVGQAAGRIEPLEAENAISRLSVERLRRNAEGRIEQLEAENAELKDTVERLRKEVERLERRNH